jgi:hypothetical protein
LACYASQVVVTAIAADALKRAANRIVSLIHCTDAMDTTDRLVCVVLGRPPSCHFGHEQSASAASKITYPEPRLAAPSGQ